MPSRQSGADNPPPRPSPTKWERGKKAPQRSGILKVMPGGGQEKGPSEGWGQGRRNPIQLVADVGVPVREAYNQWTMLDEFPQFMHRVTSVQVDDDDRSQVKWAEKIWFSKRQWEAEITEMIPD